jgi:alpha-L-rhamnosidase
LNLHAVRLRTNALAQPLGLDDPLPEFSWQLAADGENVVQSAYEIEVLDSRAQAVAWSSGAVTSAMPFGVRYGGDALRSCTSYTWRVRLWDEVGGVGNWSEPATFETSVLDPQLWRASWIGRPASAEVDNAALYLRGELELAAPVVRARAYASALGWYRLFINGRDITGDALVPRFTPLDKVVEYQTYDVTDAFRSGTNIAGIAIGDGRYRGGLGFQSHRNVYGDRLASFAQIELELADGSTLTWCTDDSWVAGTGRIRSSDPKDGERVDLRVPDEDWLNGATTPERFSAAEVLPAHPRALIAEEVERVGPIDHLKPVSIQRLASGAQLIDFGQNAAGVVRLRLRGESGSTVRLRHSEVLTPDGELDLDYLLPKRSTHMEQADEIVLDGQEGWWQPWFTIHGFRYAEISGLTADLQDGDIEFVVMSTQLQQSGTFECSDARITKLWENTRWTVRSNITDTPTDCPTRERAGWTGDIQAAAPMLTAFGDVRAFLRRYLRNLTIEQLDDGRVPPVIPAEYSERTPDLRDMSHALANASGWGDAAVRVPWTLYQYYGDPAILERQYDSARAWVDYVARQARDQHGSEERPSTGGDEQYIVNSGWQWGEWLRPEETLEDAITDGAKFGAVVATAYLAESARLLSAMAGVLDRQEEVRRYAELHANVRRAWRAAFMHEDGNIGTNRQDDYVRALAFGLLEEDEQVHATDRLVQLIEERDGHLGTGFLSTPMLLQTLVEHGRPEVALHVLTQNTAPSWLYQVERGATTLWETWVGYLPDGFAEASHNHYAFGSVCNWLRDGLLGVVPTEPGYRRIRIAPAVGSLDWVAGTFGTPFGPLNVRWERAESGSGCLDVTLPHGVEATIVLPNGATTTVGSGEHRLAW